MASLPISETELTAIATHFTEREDAARKVERLMRKVAAASLLQRRIGEVFDGIITDLGNGIDRHRNSFHGAGGRRPESGAADAQSGRRQLAATAHRRSVRWHHYRSRKRN